MSKLFEELDYQETPLGPVSLRRRRDLRLDVDIMEIMLGDEHLMSDLFTTSEIALATEGLSANEQNKPLSVVVGGLGMGFTANAALCDERVDELLIIEKLLPVINWHQDGLIPHGRELCQNAKVRFVEGDFFVMAEGEWGFDPSTSGKKFDAILLDIDHSPDFFLTPAHKEFYELHGLRNLKRHLCSGGIFALWSNKPQEDRFLHRLKSVFTTARAQDITFYNPLQDRDFRQSIYLAFN